VQGAPLHVPRRTTGVEKALSKRKIGFPRRDGGPEDVGEVVLVLPQPVVYSRSGRRRGRRQHDATLPPELQQVGQAFSSLGLSARKPPWEAAEVACDQRLIHLLSGLPLVGEPPPELITSPQIVSDTVPRIALLMPGGRQVIEGGPQQPVSQPSDHGRPRKVVLDHGLLLLLSG
jgi:hypothetical protein